MTFRVGQEVVCIDNTVYRPMRPSETIPDVGKVYTIREIVFYKERPQLLLVELVNPPQYYECGFCEPCFAASRFRPIVKTDISIFTAMLAPAPKQKEPVA